MVNLPVTADAIFGSGTARKKKVSQGLFSRWLRDREGVLTPQMFGVQPDSKRNGYRGLQDMFNIGGDILMPPGQFLTSENLILTSNTRVRGAGIDKTIIRHTDGGASVIATGYISDTPNAAWEYTNPFEMKENIVLEDMTIDGSTAVPMHNKAAVRFTWFRNVGARRLKVVNADDAGIRVDGYGGVFEDAAYLEPTALAPNPLTTTNGSGAITVAHPNHRLNNGGKVTLSGCADTNGISAAVLNAEHSISNVELNSYRIVVSTTASSSGTGGGGSIVASNARHATRWGQSSGYFVEDCVVENAYMGVEVEGGAKNGKISGLTVDDVVAYVLRLPGADGVSADNINGNNCNVGIWIDRSWGVHVRGGRITGIAGHGIAIGKLVGGSFSDLDLQIKDPATYRAITDSFQAAVGTDDLEIARISSNGTIALQGSRDFWIRKCTAPIDVVRSGSRGYVDSPESVIVQAAGLDQYSSLFGGPVHILRGKSASGGESRYAEQQGVAVRCFARFRGNAKVGGGSPSVNGDVLDLRRSIGVDRVEWRGSGLYRVYWSTAFYTSDYVPMVSSTSQITSILAITTTYMDLQTQDKDGSFENASIVAVAAYGV